jgi:hypothetical protein
LFLEPIVKYQLLIERLRVQPPAPRQSLPGRAGRYVEVVMLACVAAYFFLGACGVFVP